MKTPKCIETVKELKTYINNLPDDMIISTCDEGFYCKKIDIRIELMRPKSANSDRMTIDKIHGNECLVIQ